MRDRDQSPCTAASEALVGLHGITAGALKTAPSQRENSIWCGYAVSRPLPVQATAVGTRAAPVAGACVWAHATRSPAPGVVTGTIVTPRRVVSSTDASPLLQT